MVPLIIYIGAGFWLYSGKGFSESGKYSICLIEAGPDYNPLFAILFLKTLYNPKVNYV